MGCCSSTVKRGSVEIEREDRTVEREVERKVERTVERKGFGIQRGKKWKITNSDIYMDSLVVEREVRVHDSPLGIQSPKTEVVRLPPLDDRSFVVPSFHDMLPP